MFPHGRSDGRGPFAAPCISPAAIAVLAFSATAMASFSPAAGRSDTCDQGPLESWGGYWLPEGTGASVSCIPTFIHKLKLGSSVGMAGSCGMMGERYLNFTGTQNISKTTNPAVKVPVPTGSIYNMGAASPPYHSKTTEEYGYLAGVGVVTKIGLKDGNVAWSRPPHLDRVCNTTRFVQSIFVTDRFGVINVGYCGDDRDAVLYLDQLKAADGAVQTTVGWNVSFWPWTGESRHRATFVMVEGDESSAYIAAQSEGADKGWIVKFDWTWGISFDRPQWNRSLIWDRSADPNQPIPTKIILRSQKVGSYDVLVLLANAQVSVIDPSTGDEVISADVEVANDWDLSLLPHNESDTPNIVVAHDSRVLHPLERVYVSFYTLFEGDLNLLYTSEVDTHMDMKLRAMTVGSYDEAAPDLGTGVWLGVYTTCSGANPCPPQHPQPDQAMVVNLNMSNYGTNCSSCSYGWAGEQCTKKCKCMHGGGSSGACYDGPYHDGSCRCNTRTYTSHCFPCTCNTKNGVCDTGLNGTGMCSSCVAEKGSNKTKFFGMNCDGSCACKVGEHCDSGVHGSGRCRSLTPSHHSSSWKSYKTFLCIGAGALFLIGGLLVYFACFKPKRSLKKSYTPIA